MKFFYLIDPIRTQEVDTNSVWPDVRIKRSPNISKTCSKCSPKVMYFKKPEKVNKNLGYFCKKNCYQLSNIAQSGHTGHTIWIAPSKSFVFCFYDVNRNKIFSTITPPTLTYLPVVSNLPYLELFLKGSKHGDRSIVHNTHWESLIRHSLSFVYITMKM